MMKFLRGIQLLAVLAGLLGFTDMCAAETSMAAKYVAYQVVE